ncbi:MAG TPA: hypothetical protein VH054_14035 [Polyangiaceae bacterium]|jgi:hypothetical protein|nr:hypothetical protein [Polyangiaceae bacterium]
MTTSSPIPVVRDDDPEDVSWALSTAATQWARGDRIEALKWLRRAAEAASEAENDTRALEIAKAAADLSTPSMPPPSRPAPAFTPKVPPAAESRTMVAPKPVAPKPPQPTMKATPLAKKASSKPPVNKAPDETSKRGAVKAKPEMRPRAPLPDEKTDTHIMTEVTRLDARAPEHTPVPDVESWPTESMGSEELDSLHASEQVYGTERTRIGQPAYRPSDPPPGQAVEFRASQAVHVILWRDGDGRLRVAPRGTNVSAVTIEALLVAPSSDVDLLAWLAPT